MIEYLLFGGLTAAGIILLSGFRVVRPTEAFLVERFGSKICLQKL